MSWGANIGDVYGSDEERAMAQGGNPNQPNMGAMLNQPGAAGVSGMDILKLLFGGSPADSTRAEYNRANDRCISKGDHDACMQRDRLRDRMNEMGIQP